MMHGAYNVKVAKYLPVDTFHFIKTIVLALKCEQNRQNVFYMFRQFLSAIISVSLCRLKL